MHPLLGTWPANQARALTGNQSSCPLVPGLVLIPLNHTSQSYKPHFKYLLLLEMKSMECICFCGRFYFQGFCHGVGGWSGWNCLVISLGLRTGALFLPLPVRLSWASPCKPKCHQSGHMPGCRLCVLHGRGTGRRQKAIN